MSEYTRKNRISEALAAKGWKQVDLSERTGIPKNSINAWVNQKYQPRQKPLMKMAQVFSVSEMWLAGYDVPMERPVTQIKNDELAQLVHRIRNDEKLKELCLSIAKLNSDQIYVISNMVNELNKVNPQRLSKDSE